MIRDPRLSSLIVIMLIVAATLVAGLRAAFDWQAASNANAALGASAAQFEAALAARQAELEAAGLGGAGGGEPMIVEAPVTPVTVARTQTLLQDLLAGAGATIRSIDAPRIITAAATADPLGTMASGDTAEAPPPGASLDRIQFAIDLELPESALADVLLAVERARPVLVISGMTLRAPRRVGTDFVADADQMLSMRLDVFALAGEPEA
jgi:Type II secretion system (T2SS), protein M subtype b